MRRGRWRRRRSAWSKDAVSHFAARLDALGLVERPMDAELEAAQGLKQRAAESGVTGRIRRKRRGEVGESGERPSAPAAYQV